MDQKRKEELRDKLLGKHGKDFLHGHIKDEALNKTVERLSKDLANMKPQKKGNQDEDS